MDVGARLAWCFPEVALGALWIVGPVDQPDAEQPIAERGYRLEACHRHLDVDDRLCGKTRHRRGPVVIDPKRERTERRLDPVAFDLERTRPAGMC